MRLKESEDRVTADRELTGVIERCSVAFRKAMDDDLNTPVAIAELQRLKSDVNKLLSQGLSTKARNDARDEFRRLGDNLGLFQLDKWQFSQTPFRPGEESFMRPPMPTPRAREMSQTTDTPLVLRVNQSAGAALTDEEIEGKRIERDEARKQKNFKKADEIRQFLASHGIVIEDKPDGTSRWKR